MCEATAYHEAGHAFAATLLGGILRSVTIAPDRDDGPERHGDIQIAWPIEHMTQREWTEKAILVALAGPVAEMLYEGLEVEPDELQEWRYDWAIADRVAATILPQPNARRELLLAIIDQLKRFFDPPHHWAAIAEIADQLLAHETLEAEEINAIVAHWCG